MTTHGLFTCAFTHRNCTHEQLFQSEYQRTNRTKENKILRCFPHCCPDHVIRSYCGSSVHLQVDFHAAIPLVEEKRSENESESSESFPQPQQDDDLMVFGRFRPKESVTLAPGDEVAGSAILSSLQSEDNPTGEWIEARLIASADQNAWLYEVNHTARWYYNWGSSAAKDKRLQEHVFEVYVLYGHSSDTFQVVALTRSPSFKLVSFRRAPSEPRKRNRTDPFNRKDDAKPVFEHAHGQFDTSTSPPFARPAEYPRVVKLETGQWEEKTEARPVTRAPASTLPPLASLDHVPSLHHAPMERRMYSHRMATVAASVQPSHPSFDSRPQQIPALAYASTPRPNEFNAAYDSSNPTRSLLPSMPATLRSTPRESSVDSQSLLRIATELEIVTGVLPRLPLVGMLSETSQLHTTYLSILSKLHSSPTFHAGRLNVPVDRSLARLLSQLGVVSARTRALPPAVAEICAFVTMWLHFDPTIQRQLTTWYERSADVLLSRGALVQAHQQWLGWLHERITAFLLPSGWTTSRLVDEITEWIGHDAQRIGCSAWSTFEAFVAQVREVYVQSNPQTVNSRGRKRRRPSSSNTLVSGTWVSDLDRIQLRSSGPDSLGVLSSSEEIPFDALLWFWRQWSCVVLDHLPGTPDKLVIRSLFQTDPSSNCMQLVLDDAFRWFQWFPGGEATTAKRVGSQQFGDYRARYVRPSDHFEVELYSWPVRGALIHESQEDTTQKCAFHWHWQLHTERDEGLRMVLTLARGRLKPFANQASSLRFDLMPIRDKCEQIYAWTPLCHVQFRYERA
ncbi:hypothetical protein Poli38472_010955 [Pythium oligandrum]|uniref:Uncharacterized protein n=1 Tax=Pythium oligandrum TaxID=41045 RepID=A0A8K1FJK2_PYTOL|nr:hypothetical protein Poli38472_010955 [Pythium oligandrum]|eukprot:TMW61892.1 hypothetical protein Poli38472_010955 [Pythium oligandrum]